VTSGPSGPTRARGWTPQDIPDQTGRRALVTGVTSGIGEHTVIELARRGAEVILAARNPAKLEATIRTVTAAVPGALLHPLALDVSDLSSVRRAASQVTGPLHLLVNNAGVMATPHQLTADGFELQMATNHFGPFALTGLLLPRLVESGDGRVVGVSSQAHRVTRRPPLEDPRLHSRRYRRWSTYAKSKLADVMFVLELDERAREQGVPVKALAAHPGYSATGLMGTGRNTGNAGDRVRWTANILQAVFETVGQPAELGAYPTLMAATADLPGSTYVGPSGFLQFSGMPRIVGARPLAHDREARRRLWELSEDATGVRYLDETVSR
jgi:NAD(P)-dependent dehydrogenase (short-subunit alcohol dehydrogenase family)